ncbi:MAG: hypothetical protein PVI88_00525 [Nitrosopumilaceae archaeon]|jgi:hypothetical protein
MKTKSKNLVIIGICSLVLFSFDVSVQAQNENIRVEDESFKRQSLQRGETFTILGQITAIVIDELGKILIVLFIIIFAVKKRAKGATHDKS